MDYLSPSLFIVCVVVFTQIIKIVEQRFVGFNDRFKDVVYPLLAGLFVVIGKYLGFLNFDWSIVLPLLFTPQGIFVVIKKLLGK